MAGGLFKQPFTLNAKCIVFSVIIIAIFMMRPVFKNNIHQYLTLFIVFIISYVVLAWYDYYYDCRVLPLQRGKYSISGLFKPPAHIPNKQYDNDDNDGEGVDGEKMKMLNIKRHNLFVYVSHIILFVPILLYVAYYKGKSGQAAFGSLVALAVLTAGYHAMHLLSIIHKDPSSLLLAIYLVHLVVISPLLAYIGIMKGRTSSFVFNSLYGLAALAVVYHGTQLI